VKDGPGARSPGLFSWRPFGPLQRNVEACLPPGRRGCRRVMKTVLDQFIREDAYEPRLVFLIRFPDQVHGDVAAGSVAPERSKSGVTA
jgi:hypothetical protein